MIFDSRKQSLITVGIAVASVAIIVSCAHDFSSDFEGQTDKPLIDPGGNWGKDPICTDPQPIPSPTQEPIPEPPPPKEPSWFCKIFFFLPCCKTEGLTSLTAGDPNPIFPEPTPTPTCLSEPPVHNTDYCKVDENGNIISSDYLVTAGGDKITGTIGGCINRPIRDVWATILNFGLMKPAPVEEWMPTQRKDLENPVSQTFYVIDFRNVVGSIIGDVKWDVRYYHTVTWGSYKMPLQVAINFQRFWGSSFVEYIKGGYVLDRVNANVTSFVMTQAIKTAQYSENDMRRDLTSDMNKARTGEPLWVNLPVDAPVVNLDFSNIVNR
jgi:hypothetical protein